ncbi:MAG: cytochrome P450 [Sphingomonadaceae bacterium]|nr:cytochrome P450 [Sphingomonadaceae bacterium]
MSETALSFDPVSQEVLDDPGRHYAALARACPFYALETAHHKFWITSDYAEIKDVVLQDSPIWSFKWGNAAKDTAHDTGIVTDPPFHMAFRDVLLPGFTPKAMAAFRPQIETIAEELGAAMDVRKSGDLHDDLALPLPARVMCRMLGLPEQDYKRYKHWADELQELMFHDPEPGSHKALFKEIYAHCIALAEDRRGMLRAAGIAEPNLSHLGEIVPDDYLSRSICAMIEGRRLTDMEIVNVCATFLTGGQETTTNLIGNCVWRLLEDRARWEAVCADPALIRIAVEESLRFDPPVLAHFRTATAPIEMHGHALPDHAKLMFSIAGANRDPARFADPDKFRLDRPRPELGRHLSFGAGVHFCIGAPLARLEAQIAVQLLTSRFPKLRLAGATERIETWMYWGRRTLPVAWD